MKAVVTNIQGFSIHDGPGIRTVVFLKGCSLRCKWCANPEGISPEVQIGFIENLCIGCGKCFEACPAQALQTGKQHRVDYDKCTRCGRCVEVCTSKALGQYGTELSPEEAFDAVRRDKMFFDTSGGGVTVSGGEPLLQAAYVKRLFELCKADDINTCVETSGFIPASNLLEVLPVTDYLLFDLKHMDPALHRGYTGLWNDLILKNAELASANGADILFRMPLIPGVNDDPANLTATAAFIKRLPGKHSLQLMPFHRLGDGKYRALNLDNPMRDTPTMTAEQVEAVRQIVASCGVTCSISK